jgi:hypothetical protein
LSLTALVVAKSIGSRGVAATRKQTQFQNRVTAQEDLRSRKKGFLEGAIRWLIDAQHSRP